MSSRGTPGPSPPESRRAPRRRPGRSNRKAVHVALPNTPKRVLVTIKLQVRCASACMRNALRILQAWHSACCGSETLPSARSEGICLPQHQPYSSLGLQNDHGVHGAYPADGIEAAVHQVNQLRRRLHWDAVFHVNAQYAPNHCTFINCNPVRVPGPGDAERCSGVSFVAATRSSALRLAHLTPNTHVHAPRHCACTGLCTGKYYRVARRSHCHSDPKSLCRGQLGCSAAAQPAP